MLSQLTERNVFNPNGVHITALDPEHVAILLHHASPFLPRTLPFWGGYSVQSEDGAGADKPDADVELAAPEILPRSKARPFDREPLIISRAPNASREGLCRLLKLALTL
eukprot:CAMPEP_0172007490 /NCGR_PEP_ID=MMETSP1041-20130122/6138_1 /TAXON_ID=464988 /ORGANISM="Hemiselmis andersenii, Strain CCMP439" /LENGTH=108 /DNA_ID=CAMNT_0012661615 /DNA_START=431 /DNA_END=757 /DNA_ORIENTATION=-